MAPRRTETQVIAKCESDASCNRSILRASCISTVAIDSVRHNNSVLRTISCSDPSSENWTTTLYDYTRVGPRYERILYFNLIYILFISYFCLCLTYMLFNVYNIFFTTIIYFITIIIGEANIRDPII